MSTYNGWKNWETWVCNLWLAESYIDYQQEAQHENTHDLAEGLKELTYEVIGESTTENLFVQEIVQGFMSTADFLELAEHVKEDASEQ